MSGVLAYVLPKVIKTVSGVAAGVFVFMAFKNVYEKYFPMLQSKLTEFSSISDVAMSGGISQADLQSVRWFDVVNYVLPIPETINCLAYFVPAIVTVYVVKFVFRILDVWINGVLSLVKGG
ncbi:MAG: hypothetical protein PHR14_10180 [Oscillospiraceae bacterium]|nr:hypothetical protein [Oscillospiraceae bacterium]